MIPGLARVEEVASFLKVFGTDSAFALGFSGASKPTIDMKVINLRLRTLICCFLTKSALGNCGAKNNYRTANRFVPSDVLVEKNPSDKYRNNWR